MNANRHMEVHYIDTGFPYTITENLMDLFEGLSYGQADMFLVESLQDQGNPYWSMMQANSYKYGFSGLTGNSYYNFAHELNDFVPRLDGERRAWENLVPTSNAELSHLVIEGPGGAEANANSNMEERVRANDDTRNPQQYAWQENIDADNMTYEELLDLGESVGTQSRGLSQECISLLPVTKYKCNFFLRRKQRERCVICQMEYKRGNRQIILPCKHAYHSVCVSRWLSINKACPVCFAEVPNNEPMR